MFAKLLHLDCACTWGTISGTQCRCIPKQRKLLLHRKYCGSEAAGAAECLADVKLHKLRMHKVLCSMLQFALGAA